MNRQPNNRQSFHFKKIKICPNDRSHLCSPTTVQARSFLNFAVDRWPQARSFLNFAVDRWLGVEGVMAVSAYPGIGGKLLVEGVFEKPEHGRPTIYQTICPWPSTPQFDSLRENVNLFSMPGGVAFFYYSGSVIVVILFVILIAFLLQYTELLIFLITGNPILCSGLGWLMAVTFIHFGGVPRYQVPTFIFLVFAVAAAGVIQSKKTASILEALTE